MANAPTLCRLKLARAKLDKGAKKQKTTTPTKTTLALKRPIRITNEWLRHRIEHDSDLDTG